MKYLKEDITGVCSRIEYGKAGDEIEVLDDTGPMYLIKNKGVRFFVWPEKLSDLSEGVKEEVVELVGPEIKQAWLPQEEKANEQTDLFGSIIHKGKRKKK